MTTTEQETILSKIQKLLALAQSSNPNEAASALAKAQALLLQHNLSMAEVEALQGRGEDPLKKYIRHDVRLTSNRRWRKKLFFVLASNNFCRGFERGGSNLGILIGERHNIDAVLEMLTVIEPQIEHMAAVAYQRQGRGYVRASWINAFCYGCAKTINERLQAERAALANKERALVVRVDVELKEKEAQLFPRVGKPVTTVIR